MSRKIVIALVLFVVIVGGAFLIVRLKSSSLDYKNQQVIAEIQTEKLYKDSDNDGLKDWEEQLWGTDPNNPDTNGDGIKDAEEIRMGINPLGKGPDDKLATDTIQKKVNPSIESDLTETDKVSRELFAKLLAAKRDGKNVSVTDYNNFLLEAIANSPEGNTTVYRESDFKKVADTKTAIRDYGNALAKISAEKAKEFPGNELTIFDDATNKNDPKILDGLDSPINRYKAIRDEMLLMSVPSTAVSIHSKIVNLFSLMITGIQNMKYIFTDPIKAVNGVSLYPNSVGYFVTAMTELRDYFIKNGVIFNKNEAGYDFTR